MKYWRAIFSAASTASEPRAEHASDALLADAIRKGWVRPPAAPQGALPPRRPVAPLADILNELAADRGDR
jgi:hypothetical protein